MRLRAAHIVIMLTLPAILVGCGRNGRVIPKKKLMGIYTEMFLADQWIRDHADVRAATDTSLFFDPIFRRYGYNFKDYDRSVHYYLDRPEKYGKMLNRAADRIRKEGAGLGEVAEKEQARLDEIRHLLGLHRWKDFSTDSLCWSGPETMWPVYEAVDTLPPLVVVSTGEKTPKLPKLSLEEKPIR